MPLFNSEISPILIWSANCVITDSLGFEKLAITDTKLFQKRYGSKTVPKMLQ